MCGIVGIFDSRGTHPIDENLLSRMNDSLFHRGPDGEGLFVDPGIGLGHRRLSIIDLSGGAQPLFNEDHSVVVSYNGEIYNFQDLSRDLIKRGHQFRTHCDTEVIVHAWEEWGEACVDRFRGMFAFAIWDKKQQTLFLARDRLGIKPLYYAERGDGTVLFGSELKALLCDNSLARNLDSTAVEDYFAFGYVPDPKTIYRNVFKLAPGHVLAWRRGQAMPQPRCYWNPSFEITGNPPEEEIVEELIHRFRDAVDCRLVSEVPLGAFLSGGVDSSGVVAMMAGLSDDPVNTCSISFGDPAFDESSHAALVAQRYGTNHRVGHVEADKFDLIDRVARLYDEPFADSSAMPTYRVCEIARRHVTVALSGDGGDEVFGGYRRYRWHCYEEKLRRTVPQAIRGPLFGLLGRAYPKMDWAPKMFRAKSTLQALARNSAGGYFHTVSVGYDGVRNRMFSDGFRSDLQGYSALNVMETHMRNAQTDDPLSAIQYADMKTYLPGDILTKVDRASMAHSLEVRVPLLDHPLVEWAGTFPSTQKLKGMEGKYVLKKALEPYVPHDVMYRPKMGFAIPLSESFKGELRDKVQSAFTSDILLDTGFFDPAYLRTIVNDHQSGVREHSAVIWSVLMFESFLRQVHEERDHHWSPKPNVNMAAAGE
ncbi:MAG: amidotransferase 1, exosortase A system-associated [Rhodospirillaceae bacterium]|jgi:asparagine synthase (glutamine-hydrolysing)|nr:amidotransferase 1, exosortase A system-associated [Rhodospirillaceae bacterium]MBT5455861.1 amidotransferase 1, exosortase A system-associated [Rhodospirillaceae bacterium]